MTSDPTQEPDELEEVFRSIDATQLQMARDLLTEADIECFIFDAAASRMFGSIVAVPARLMVFADSAKEARDRLEESGFIGK